MELTIINPPATLWDTKSNAATDALQALGYSVYGLTTDPTIQADWIYVVYANGQPQTIDIPVGYEWVKDVKPWAGYSNTGSTVKFPNNAGLNALFTHYIALNGLAYPNVITHAQLAAIDLTGIDPKDFSITVKDGIITNLVMEPYEADGITIKPHLL